MLMGGAPLPVPPLACYMGACVVGSPALGPMWAVLPSSMLLGEHSLLCPGSGETEAQVCSGFPGATEA